MYFANGPNLKTCPHKAPPASSSPIAPTPHLGSVINTSLIPAARIVSASSGTFYGWNHMVHVLLLLGNTLVRFIHSAVCGCKLCIFTNL